MAMSGIVEGWRWGRNGRRAVAGLVVGAVATVGLASGSGAASASAAGTVPAAAGESTASHWLSGHNEFGGGSARSLWLSDVARAIKSDRLPSNADGRGIDVALIDTGIAPVSGLDAPEAVANGADLSLDHQIGAPA